MNRYATLMGVGYVIALVLLPLSWYLGFIPGIAIAALVFVVALYFSCKVEKIKKQYDVQTYREIVAFSNGETLDEIAKVRESGKRKYQTFLIVLGSSIVGFVVALAIIWILRIV